MVSPSYYDSNVYLINKRVLIDTGMSCHKVIAALSKLVDISNIELIIFTHGHYDHTGVAPEILNRSSAKVGLFSDEAPFLNDPDLSASNVFGSPSLSIVPDVLYSDNDLICVGTDTSGANNYLTVIHTPGHTAGSMCLYEPESGILFSGDTVFSEGGIGRTDFENSIREKMSESIEKLLSLGVKTIYPGHGAPTFQNAQKDLESSYKMSLLMNR